jgi:hypothetical protein
MSALLRQALEQLERELPEYEQDVLAKHLMMFLEIEERDWNRVFEASSVPQLAKLAEKLQAQYRAGATEPLDLKRL